MAHCNLKCYFCDTDFAQPDATLTDSDAWKNMIHRLKKSNDIIVITGGEPMRQNLIPMIAWLRETYGSGQIVQIETAGTLWIEGIEDLWPCFVVSPKTKNVVDKLESYYTRIHDQMEGNGLGWMAPYLLSYKYIVGEDTQLDVDGLPMSSTQVQGKIHQLAKPPQSCEVYIQPRDDGNEDRNHMNLKRCVEVCMQHGYRLSIQMHKLANLP